MKILYTTAGVGAAHFCTALYTVTSLLVSIPFGEVDPKFRESVHVT